MVSPVRLQGHMALTGRRAVRECKAQDWNCDYTYQKERRVARLYDSDEVQFPDSLPSL